MHAVLKFLVHAVDLEGSVWQGYLHDPRYQNYYRAAFFDRSNMISKDRVDFWYLVNEMCSPVTFQNCCLNQEWSTHEDARSNLVFPCVGSHTGFCASGASNPILNKFQKRVFDPESFQTLYHHHLHLAKSLRCDSPAPTSFETWGITNLGLFGQISKFPLLSDQCSAPAYLEFFAPPHTGGRRYSLVAQAGPIPAPTLIATLKQDGTCWKIFPSTPGWTQWWPQIMDKYYALLVK